MYVCGGGWGVSVLPSEPSAAQPRVQPPGAAGGWGQASAGQMLPPGGQGLTRENPGQGRQRGLRGQGNEVSLTAP